MGAVTAGVVMALVAAGCGSSSNSQPTSGTFASLITQAAPTAQVTPKRVRIDVDDNPAKGPADAKVTIVELSDFKGPNCAAFALQTLPQILANYGDKIRFVFMNLPGKNTYSEKAAEAGECANAQGAFWQYHDLLFQNQQALTSALTPDPTAGLAVAVESFKSYAAQMGLDTAKFNDCLDSGEMASSVQADIQVGVKAYQDTGSTGGGTPLFFINGNLLAGSKPYSVFKQAIDAALAAAK